MFNIIITFLNVVVLITLIYFLFKQRNALISLEEENTIIIQNDTEFKEILLLGLYNRFKKDNEEILDAEYEDDDTRKSTIEELSALLKLERPADFKIFAAKVIKDYYGGSTYILDNTGDYGVDFEHDTEKGRLIGQVKSFETDLPYQHIAILHSNIVKDNLIGGYIITTSDFTDNAYEYAKKLNIELINGEKLVEYWLAGLHKTNKQVEDEKEEDIRLASNQ